MKNDDIETNRRQMNDVGIFSVFVFNLTFHKALPNKVNLDMHGMHTHFLPSSHQISRASVRVSDKESL